MVGHLIIYVAIVAVYIGLAVLLRIFVEDGTVFLTDWPGGR